jgi:hypothetical protein
MPLPLPSGRLPGLISPRSHGWSSRDPFRSNVSSFRGAEGSFRRAEAHRAGTALPEAARRLPGTASALQMRGGRLRGGGGVEFLESRVEVVRGEALRQPEELVFQGNLAVRGVYGKRGNQRGWTPISSPVCSWVFRRAPQQAHLPVLPPHSSPTERRCEFSSRGKGRGAPSRLRSAQAANRRLDCSGERSR